MKTDFMFDPDLLSILFENRNREYGAYELRIHYRQRLLRSLCIVPAILVLLFTAKLLGNRTASGSPLDKMKIQVGDTIRLVEFRMSPPPRPSVPIPLKTPHRIHVAMVPEVTPIVVRDEKIPTMLPTTDQLEINRIGTVLQNAGPDESINEAPSGSGKGNGQEEKIEPAPANEMPLGIAENMPEFPGGIEALKRFLMKNLKMPGGGMDPGTTVRVLVQFVVDGEGTIERLELLESGGKVFDSEVFRVIKKMPRWKPGMQNGHRVAVFFKLPVVFQVPGDN